MGSEENNYHTLFNNHPLPMLVMCGVTLKILAANVTACQLFGYNPQDFLQMPASSLFAPQEKVRFDVLFGKFPAEAGKIMDPSKPWRLYRKDGTFVQAWILQSAIRFQGRDGRLLVLSGGWGSPNAPVFGLASPNPDSRWLHSGVCMHAVARATHDTIYEWDIQTDILCWDEGVRSVFGYSDVIQITNMKWWEDRIHPDDKQRVHDSLYRAVYDVNRVWSAEYRFARADASYAYVLDRGLIIADERGRPLRMIGMMIDITAHKEIEEKANQVNQELLKLNRIRSDFISVVSHELKTPLTVLMDGVDMILEGMEGSVSEGQKEILLILKKNIDRLVRLSREVLDYNRLERGKVKLNFTEVRLCELLREVGQFMDLSMQKKRITLRILLPENLVMAVIDSDKIRQVMINLLDNAVKYTNEGGMISIRLGKEGNHVRIEVEDTGKGIKPEDQQNIFGMFERGPDDMCRHGFGVGLAVCKQIVKQHRGQIYLDGSYHNGCRFVILLPNGPVSV